MTDHLAVTRTAEFDLSPDELWALVSDGRRWSEWMVDRADIDVAEGATGTLGPITYDPGIAARIVSLTTNVTGAEGVLTTAAESYDTRYEAFNGQIDRFEERMVIKEAQLRRQWTTVQTLLSSLQNQQSWLTSQISSLSS